MLHFEALDLLGITNKRIKIQFQYSVASSIFTPASTLDDFMTVALGSVLPSTIGSAAVAGL